MDEATDVGRRFPPKPKNEVRRGLGVRAAVLRKETVEMGRALLGEAGDGARVALLAVNENGRVMVPLAMWYCRISSLVASGRMRVWCGKMMALVN
jgi:hypothetical protein